MKLLQCYTCRSLDTFPDVSESVLNVLLEETIQKYHITNDERHRGILIDIDKDVLEKLKRAGNWEKQVFDMEIAREAVRDEYLDEAGKCYNRHGRPKGGCPDFHDPSKKVGQPTPIFNDAGQKTGMTSVYLCDWCPVLSFVATEVRWKKGMYKDNG